MFYCATFVLISLGYNLLFWMVIYGREADATRSHPHGEAIARIRRAYRIGLVAYLTAALVAVFSPWGGLAICLSLWALWMFLSYVPRD